MMSRSEILLLTLRDVLIMDTAGSLTISLYNIAEINGKAVKMRERASLLCEIHGKGCGLKYGRWTVLNNRLPTSWPCNRNVEFGKPGRLSQMRFVRTLISNTVERVTGSGWWRSSVC